MTWEISVPTKFIRFAMVESIDLDQTWLEKIQKDACYANFVVLGSNRAKLSQHFHFFCDSEWTDKIYPIQKYANETPPSNDLILPQSTTF